MHTLLMLLENMAHSSLTGIIGVGGIFLFLIGMVAAGVYRSLEAESEEKH